MSLINVHISFSFFIVRCVKIIFWINQRPQALNKSLI